MPRECRSPAPVSVGSWCSGACQWGGGGGGRDEPDRRVTVEERRRRDKAGGGCWRRESLTGAHQSRSEGDCSRAEAAALGVAARGSASTRGTGEKEAAELGPAAAEVWGEERPPAPTDTERAGGVAPRTVPAAGPAPARAALFTAGRAVYTGRPWPPPRGDAGRGRRCWRALGASRPPPRRAGAPALLLWGDGALSVSPPPRPAPCLLPPLPLGPARAARPPAAGCVPGLSLRPDRRPCGAPGVGAALAQPPRAERKAAAAAGLFPPHARTRPTGSGRPPR